MMDVIAIQQDIAAGSLGWTAEENYLTQMSVADQDKRLGYAPDPASGEMALSVREIHAAAVAQAIATHAEAAGTAAAPASIDLRDYNGHNYITSVRDQKECGSCVSFGSIAAVEGTTRFVNRNANLNIDLSENHLFNCIARSQGRNCQTGWWVDPALTALRDQGVVDEACSPYSPADQQCVLCSNWQSRLTKIRSFQQITSIAAMKDWLAMRGPLVACFTVYSDFFAYHSGVYRRSASSVARGGHCVCVVGYEDANNAWICKNSWNDTWGDRGFFRIAYGQCGIDASMWGVETMGIQPSQNLAALHRYWNPSAGDHFYTTSWAELGGGRYGWIYEGVQCDISTVSGPGLVPLYRYWNGQAGDHFYTTNWAELGSGRYGWAYEGIQGYVSPTPGVGLLALYRYWNPSIADHFYTTSWAELGPSGYGWNYEGIQCYVWPSSATVGDSAVPESFRVSPRVAAISVPSFAAQGDAEPRVEQAAQSFTMAGLTPLPASFQTLSLQTAQGAGPPARFAINLGKSGCGCKQG